MLLQGSLSFGNARARAGKNKKEKKTKEERRRMRELKQNEEHGEENNQRKKHRNTPPKRKATNLNHHMTFTKRLQMASLRPCCPLFQEATILPQRGEKTPIHQHAQVAGRLKTQDFCDWLFM